MESINNRESGLKSIIVFFILIATIPILLLVGSAFMDHKNDNIVDAIFDNNDIKKKPVKTNSWFTGLYRFPSPPIYAHPGVYKIESDGVGISYPDVTVESDTVFGTYVPQCKIRLPEPIIDTNVINYTDWHVDIELITNSIKGKVTIIQGSPFIYSDFIGEVQIYCENYLIESSTQDSATIVNNEKRFFIQSTGKIDIKTSELNAVVTIASGKSRIGIIPENAPEAENIFRSSPWISDDFKTLVTWSIADSQVNTILKLVQGDNLMTIWPHHKPYLKTSEKIVGTYITQLGEIELIETDTIELVQEKPNLPLSFNEVVDESNKSLIVDAIEKDIETVSNLSYPDGVYSKGVLLGALASLTELTQIYTPADVDRVTSILERELLSSIESFTYDPERKMYSSLNSEFNNKEGNDHHFHYGYYIRAAATLVKIKPELRSKLDTVINEMISDIATIDTIERYPRLRVYSPYEGHSWADGTANFNDGNNQESTSEALNAWYGIYLWGEVTKQAKYSDLGLWLFSQELTGTKAYWWAESNSFPEEFDHEIASIVWGGKRDFSTWFSPEVMHIYGIQILPITPASIYLRDLEKLTLYTNEIESQYENPLSHEWGDLYLILSSYDAPAQAVNRVSEVSKTDGVKLPSLFLQTIYSNSENN